MLPKQSEKDYLYLLIKHLQIEQFCRVHTNIGTYILHQRISPEKLVAITEENEELNRDSANSLDYIDIVIVAKLHSFINTNLPHTNRLIN